MGFKNIMKKIFDFGDRNSSAILTGTALFGLLVTTVNAYKAGTKADAIIKKKKEEFHNCETKEEKKEVIKESAKELAPILAPTIVGFGATAVAMLVNHKKGTKKIAMLSAAYSLSEKTIKDLNDKMEDILGKKKTREVKDAILKDKMTSAPAPSTENIPSDGNVWAYDSFTGRYFRTNAQKIGKAINDWSAKVKNEVYSELNEFYYLLGQQPTGAGVDYGYTDRDLISGTLPVTYTAMLIEDGTPCLCIDYTGLHLIDRAHRFM